MKRFKTMPFLSATLAAVLALSMFGGLAAAQTPPATQAQQSGPRPIEVAGEVTSVTSSGFTLKSRRGDFTINVSSNTWIVVEKDGGRAEGTLSDIQTGKAAVVAGMTTSDPAVIDARVVRQGALAKRPVARAKARDLARHLAGGTIKSVSGSTITVTTGRGTEVTINTSADTVVLNGGFKTVSTLKAGDSIQVVGKPSRPEKPAGSPPAEKPARGSRTIEAFAIRVVTTNSALSIGRVESVSGNTVTLRTPKERSGISVTLDGSTEYRTLADGKLTPATQADVQAGGNLIVEGVTGVDGKSVTAKAIIILPGGKTRAAQP